MVAYALAGRMDIDLNNDPLGEDSDGEPVYLRDIWPTGAEIADAVEQAVRADMFTKSYADVFTGDERWKQIEVPEGDRYTWPDSTYVRRPSFFEGMDAEPKPVEPVQGARVLALLGDSVTTDHISPAGAIKKDSPAGKWLIENGVEPGDFNSYGARRGNHEVMIRGTFANVRLRNALADKDGGHTSKFPDGEQTTIYEAAMGYAEEGTPLVVLGGKEYGSGSSRDWAAKGTTLLGVRAVIAESFERIHRSNLIGMGVLPLQFPEGESIESLGLTGEETFDLGDIENGEAKEVEVTATPETAPRVNFTAKVRIDTPERGRLLPERRHPPPGAARPARPRLTLIPLAVRALGAVAVVAGAFGVLTGPEGQLGGEAVNASVESEYRFYAGLWIGYGAVAWSWLRAPSASRRSSPGSWPSSSSPASPASRRGWRRAPGRAVLRADGARARDPAGSDSASRRARRS